MCTALYFRPPAMFFDDFGRFWWLPHCEFALLLRPVLWILSGREGFLGLAKALLSCGYPFLEAGWYFITISELLFFFLLRIDLSELVIGLCLDIIPPEKFDLSRELLKLFFFIIIPLMPMSFWNFDPLGNAFKEW